MMTQNKFLKEAIRIGDDILAWKEFNKHGFYWKTMWIDTDKKITWQISESIYSGTGGIVLFLIELYKQTGEKKYLEAAYKGSDWLIHHVNRNPTDYYAFFTGRMGLTYVFLQIYQLTEEEIYLNEAVRITLHSTYFLNKKDKDDDLLNGTAGSLLGLLLLYSKTKEEKLLPIMNRFLDHLLKNVQIGPKGIYWDKNSRQTRGLCGFSHGASGVGYVFLQLGFYFKNPSFYWIAEQAFAYENYFFDEKLQNWPDFRNGIYSENDFVEHKQAWLNRNFDFFNKTGNMMAWCHGSPGIGFSRLHACESLKKEYLKRDYRNSLESTRRATITPMKETDTFTLCHGKGGNAMLFLESFKRLNDKKAYDKAKEISLQALEYRNKYDYYLPGFNFSTAREREDLSLFMGNAGIGYFYLMCENPHEVPSILAPRVTGNCNADISDFNFLSVDLATLKKQILERVFPRTLILAKNSLNDLDHVFKPENDPSEDVKETFVSYISTMNIKNKKIKLKALNDLLELEKKKLETELNTNPAFQNIKLNILDERARKLVELPNGSLIRQKLVLNEDVTLFQSRWHWPEDIKSIEIDTFIEKPENPQHYLFIKCPLEVKEHEVSEFIYEILNTFKTPRKISEAIQKMLQDFYFENKKEEERSKKIISNQIRELIRSLILIEPDSNIVI